MTTDAGKTEATVEETQQADATANPVEQAVAELTDSGAITAEDMRRQIGSLQGSIADRAGRDRKAVDSRLERLESTLGDIANANYEQRLANMSYDERENFLLEENKRLREAPQPQQNVQESWLNAEEQTAMATYTDAILDSNGLSLNKADPSLWVGAYEGMPYEQLKQVVTRNAKAMVQAPASPASQPTTNTQQTEGPPPSMQGAPSTTVVDYDSRASVARALMDGDIGSEDVRRIYTDKGW